MIILGCTEVATGDHILCFHLLVYLLPVHQDSQESSAFLMFWIKEKRYVNSFLFQNRER